MLKKVIILLVILVLLSGCSKSREAVKTQGDLSGEATAITIDFPSKAYPETAMHIREAVSRGKTILCTIDREHAIEHREKSLRGIPTKKGKDRDEWPMALCKEGGSGADVKYISPSDNRGAGAWVRNKLRKYRDGTKVRFIVRHP